MNEYALTVFSVCVITGVLGLVSYGSGRAEKLALGVITLYIIIAPLVSELGNIDIDSLFDKTTMPEYELEGGFSQVAEDAFAEGIAKAVAEEFSVDLENIRVKIRGFDFENMRAEQITVILSGRSVAADYRSIEKYLNDLDVGVCRVEIEIG